MQNPLRQNYKHMKTLAELTGIPEECFKSLVVFAGDCVFKTEMPANVVYARDFICFIRGFQEPVLKDDQLPDIGAVIGEWAGPVTEKQRANHVEHLRNKKMPVRVDGPPPLCPHCGTTMTLRTSRKDNNKFWGCPKYPACRGKRQAV